MKQLLRHLKGIRREGLVSYLKQVWYLREYRGGTLVGRDAYGNRYYELNDDPSLPFYRKRYAELAGTDEPSRIPPEWHGWLHYTNDDAPSQTDVYVSHSWMTAHTPNWTGSDRRYVPYSTTVRKIVPFAEGQINMQRSFNLANPTLPTSNYPPTRERLRQLSAH